MKKMIQEYKGKDVIVSYNPKICIHAAACVTGLPKVFNVMKRPWVEPENASAEEIIAQIKKCPSGALQYEKLSEE